MVGCHNERVAFAHASCSNTFQYHHTMSHDAGIYWAKAWPAAARKLGLPLPNPTKLGCFALHGLRWLVEPVQANP
jgi:hypothetical protein